MLDTGLNFTIPTHMGHLELKVTNFEKCDSF